VPTGLRLTTHAALALVLVLASATAHAQRRHRGARLTIQTEVEGAEVLVDEEMVGVTPLRPIEVEPGQHTVRVRKPGYTEFTDVVRVRPGENAEVSVDLMALSMVLTVRSDPDEARVFVDGTFRGTSPIELELTEGRHTIRVTDPTHREVVRHVTAAPGQTRAIDVRLEPLPESALHPRQAQWYDDPLIWVAIGGGAAAVAVAIVLIVVLTQGGSQIDSYCGGEEMNCIRVTPDWTF
jgi:hypothetical protein